MSYKTFDRFEAGARKSAGEFKPLIVKVFKVEVACAPGTFIEKKETEVVGTDYDGINADGSQKWGFRGKYRGLTFATREEAVTYAAEEIERRAAALAEHEARLLARRMGPAMPRVWAR